jgi:hypothetical protein
MKQLAEYQHERDLRLEEEARLREVEEKRVREEERKARESEERRVREEKLIEERRQRDEERKAREAKEAEERKAREEKLQDEKVPRDSLQFLFQFCFLFILFARCLFARCLFVCLFVCVFSDLMCRCGVRRQPSVWPRRSASRRSAKVALCCFLIVCLFRWICKLVVVSFFPSCYFYCAIFLIF